MAGDAKEEEEVLMPWLIPYLVALGLLSFCIIIGNILVLTTFIRDKTLRNPTGLIIISLASSDFLTGLIGVPSILMSMVPRLKIFLVDPGCWFSGMMVHSLFSCALLNLTLISLQRYYLITKPHNNFFNKCRVKFMILGIWIYAFGTSCVPLLPWMNGYAKYIWSLSCIMNYGPEDGYLTKYYGSAYNTLTFLVTSLTIMVTQYRILRIVFTRTKSAKTASDSKRQLSEQRRFYATKMIACMILGFAVCIVPLMIMMFIKVANKIPPKQYAAFAAFMTWTNSVVNPTIYWYFNRTYSSGVRESFNRGKKSIKEKRHSITKSKSLAKISLLRRGSEGTMRPESSGGILAVNQTLSTMVAPSAHSVA